MEISVINKLAGTVLGGTTAVSSLLTTETAIEAAIVSTVCLLAFSVGAVIIRKEYEKKNIVKGILIGVFAGISVQLVAAYYPSSESPVAIGMMLFCLFPTQISEIFLKLVGKKADKL
tara:strand:- start:156 stop:506 length:351 start_codon:yes stop_codon:yes gene_type:complete